jgi:hypothetical protein
MDFPLPGPKLSASKLRIKHLTLALLFAGLTACQSSSSDAVVNDASVDEDRAAVREFSLDEVQHRTLNFFWETALPGNYQIPDRWQTKRFNQKAFAVEHPGGNGPGNIRIYRYADLLLIATVAVKRCPTSTRCGRGVTITISSKM